MKITMKNFKGGDGTIELTARTVLTGPVGAGKSRVLEALVFALSGQVPGLTETAVWVYGVEDKETVVEVQLDSGGTITRGFTRHKNRVTKPFAHIPDNIKLPPIWMMAAKQFFEMAPKDQRQGLLSVLLGSPKAIANEVRTKLDMAGAGKWYHDPKPGEDIPTWLARLTEALSEIAKTRKEDVTTMEARLKPYAMEGVPADPVEAISAIADEIARLRNLDKGTDVRREIEETMQGIEDAKATLETLRDVTPEALENLERRLAELEAMQVVTPAQDLQAARKEVARLEAEFVQRQEAGRKLYANVKNETPVQCPIINDTCLANDQMRAHIKGVLTEAIPTMRKLKEQLDQARQKASQLRQVVDKTIEERNAIDREKGVITQKIQHLRTNLPIKKRAHERLLVLEKKLSELPLVPPEQDTQAIQTAQQIRELENKKSKLEEAARRKSDYEAMVRLLDEARKEYETVKAAKKALKQVTTEKVLKQLTDLLVYAGNLLNKVVPGASLGIKQARGQITWAWQYQGNETPAAALSQGERVLVSASILAALWKMAKIQVPVKLLTVEAAEVDDAHITPLLQVLDQTWLDKVVVATCHTPPDQVAGWEVRTP